MNNIACYAICTRATGQNDLQKVFTKGFKYPLLNPKVVLFFWVFLQRAMHWLERVAGARFIGFGLKPALMDNPSH